MAKKMQHMADKINPRGGVSALCFSKPRAINLATATWTLRPEAVTCKKCMAIMKAAMPNAEVKSRPSSGD